MANSANTFTSLQGLFKTVYSKGDKSRAKTPKSPSKNKYKKLTEMLKNGKG